MPCTATAMDRNFERSYRMRRPFWRTEFFSQVVFLAALILAWSPALLPVMFVELAGIAPYRFCFYLSLTLIMVRALVYKLNSEYDTIEFTVLPECLLLKRPKRISVIMYGDVERFVYVKGVLRSGYGLICARGVGIRLPMRIERLDKLCGDLMRMLSLHSRPNVFNTESMARLRRDALAGQGWSAIAGRLLGPVIFWCALLPVINAVIAQRIWLIPVVPTVLWSLTAFAFPPAFFLLYRASWKRQCGRNPESAPREVFTAPDGHLMLASGLATASVYFICGILFRAWFGHMLLI